MDKIRLRNIIDQAQAKLAYEARLVSDQATLGASLRWREKLPNGNIPKRLKAANKNVHDAGLASGALLDLLNSVEGMALVSENNSRVRHLGDSIAHERITESSRGPYSNSISRLGDGCGDVEAMGRGLHDLLDFIVAS